MKRLDAIKLALLLTAILVWFEGYRLDNHAVMLSAIAFVVLAFALRFLKLPPKAPPT